MNMLKSPTPKPRKKTKRPKQRRVSAETSAAILAVAAEQFSDPTPVDEQTAIKIDVLTEQTNQDQPEQPSKVTLRGSILAEGKIITESDHQISYGDPLFNLSTIAKLKSVFWNAFYESNRSVQFHDRCGRNSAHGHAIDMVLTKLARIATSPDESANRNSYTDMAVYSAIAYEMAIREKVRES